MNLAASQYGAEEVAPIREGRTYLSLANCEDFFGYTVEQSGDGAVTLRAGGKQIAMKIGEKAYTANGNATAMDAAPFEDGGTVYIPVRFVQEALGGIVDWDGKNRTVIVAKRPNPGAVTEFTESLDPLGISLIVPDAVDYNEIGGKYVFTAKEALGQYENEPGTLFTIAAEDELPLSNLEDRVLRYADSKYIVLHFPEEGIGTDRYQKLVDEMIKSIKSTEDQ